MTMVVIICIKCLGLIVYNVFIANFAYSEDLQRYLLQNGLLSGDPPFSSFHPPMSLPDVQNVGPIAYPGVYTPIRPSKVPDDDQLAYRMDKITEEELSSDNNTDLISSSYEFYPEHREEPEVIESPSVAYVSLGTTNKPVRYQLTTPKMTWSDLGLRNALLHNPSFGDYLSSVLQNQLSSEDLNTLKSQLRKGDIYPQVVPNFGQKPFTELDMTSLPSNDIDETYDYDYYGSPTINNPQFLPTDYYYYGFPEEDLEKESTSTYAGDAVEAEEEEYFSFDFIGQKIQKLLDIPDDARFKLQLKAVIPYGSVPGKQELSKGYNIYIYIYDHL